MSPSLVNQTALLDLPKAFLNALSEVFDVRPQYFGRAMGAQSAVEQRSLLMHELGKMLGNPFAYSSSTRANRSNPTFFLDPLYVMFGGVCSVDSVLVLDVSPVTNPAWHRQDVANAYAKAYKNIVAAQAHCFFISENTRVAFNQFFGTVFEPKNVIHLFLPEKRAVDTDPTLGRYPFFLFVGSLEKRKNIVGMVKAFQASNLAAEGYKLVIVGGNGHGHEEIPAAYFADPSIVFTGYLSDTRINELYTTATGLLYLSYLEGFGVPIIEAMHFGLPIIATTCGAVPEVLGGNGMLVDPDDHLAAGSKLREVAALSELERTQIGNSMKARVAQYFSRQNFEATVKRRISERYRLEEQNAK